MLTIEDQIFIEWYRKQPLAVRIAFFYYIEHNDPFWLLFLFNIPRLGRDRHKLSEVAPPERAEQTSLNGC